MMSVKKSDYFGKFLDTLSDRGPIPADPANEAPRTSNPRQQRTAIAPTELLDRCLSLLKTGPKSLKDLLLPGDSFSAVFGALQQLQDIGYVERADEDMFQLTAKGRDVTQVISSP